jgi:hypothetical protein
VFQILEILVRAVVEDMTDNHGDQASSLRAKVQELLGRVTSRHSTDAEIWRHYALLYGDGHSTRPEDNEKVRPSNIPVTFDCANATLEIYFVSSGGGEKVIIVMDLEPVKSYL